MDPSFGQHAIMDHQRTMARAQARERLSVEDQVAWGGLDEQAAPVPLGRCRRHISRTLSFPPCAWASLRA
jgi:hypothetical protein